MYDPNFHRRRSIRLRGYDYGQAGAYFITICTAGRASLFGHVLNGTLRLSVAGEIVANEWLRTPSVRPNVDLDAFVVMPNHVHAIVVMSHQHAREPQSVDGHRLRSPSHTLGAIVRGFKAAVTSRSADANDVQNAIVWQRNYYERIIRNEDELNAVRQYIADNPARWGG
jgi:REP element-mobilizing transposase RayT